MSTRTIAVDSRVYQRLAQAKHEGESFSRTIDRLLTEVGSAHTGRDILRLLEPIAPLPADEATVMLRLVEENRADEAWEEHDLR